jgi:integrase
MRYYTYLALKKYLKATESQFVQHLPPTDEFTKPGIGKKTTRYSRDQIEKLIEQASDTQLELTIILMSYSGLRSYEILHLQPSWLEFKEDRIEIEIAPQYAKGDRKNAKPQYCYLISKYEDQLKKYIKSSYSWKKSYKRLVEEIAEDEVDDKYLFNFIEDSDKSFQELARERYHLNEELKETAKKAGINNAGKLTSHRLRASFIEFIQNTTKDIEKTKHMARHSKIETTGRYLESKEEQKIETYHSTFS